MTATAAQTIRTTYAALCTDDLIRVAGSWVRVRSIDRQRVCGEISIVVRRVDGTDETIWRRGGRGVTVRIG